MERIIVCSVSVGAAITTGRLQALVGLAAALVSVVLGVLARSASARRPRGRAIAAVMSGLASVALSGVHLATVSGAIGTGSGRGGAILALIVGLIGTCLGGLVLRRVRRPQ